jgi:hypothetical protein
VKTQIWCEPAECYSGCSDHECPYTHRDIWRRGDTEETFRTRFGAETYGMNEVDRERHNREVSAVYVRE